MCIAQDGLDFFPAQQPCEEHRCRASGPAQCKGGADIFLCQQMIRDRGLRRNGNGGWRERKWLGRYLSRVESRGLQRGAACAVRSHQAAKRHQQREGNQKLDEGRHPQPELRSRGDAAERQRECSNAKRKQR